MRERGLVYHEDHREHEEMRRRVGRGELEREVVAGRTDEAATFGLKNEWLGSNVLICQLVIRL